MVDLNLHYEVLRKSQDLTEAIAYFSDRGWCPATSSNFSFRLSNGDVLVTRSGIDKSKITIHDFVSVDIHGKALTPTAAKASAETMLHLGIYEKFPRISCVLHTHSVKSSAISQHMAETKKLVFSDLEILKAFAHRSTHEQALTFPIFSNSQSMDKINQQFYQYLADEPTCFGYLIAGHGLYTWSDTIAGAKRQVEAFEYLLEYSCLIEGTYAK